MGLVALREEGVRDFSLLTHSEERPGEDCSEKVAYQEERQARERAPP